MAHVLINTGVVVQKQPNPAQGFIEAPDWVVCGMAFDGQQFLPRLKSRVSLRGFYEL